MKIDVKTQGFQRVRSKCNSSLGHGKNHAVCHIGPNDELLILWLVKSYNNFENILMFLLSFYLKL